MKMQSQIQEEHILHPLNGLLMLFLLLVGLLGSVTCFVLSILYTEGPALVVLITASILLFLLCCIGFGGLKILNPNEALVLALFGNYYGTLKKDGFFFVNPFCTAINPTVKTYTPTTTSTSAGINLNLGRETSKKVSLKTMTLNNEKQKVNDEQGNPVEIGTVVIWKVSNATKAVLNVENYKRYLSIQCDAITRNAARCFPYDAAEGIDERSLRGSSQEVADIMKTELQEKVDDAGILILEVRITHLSYAPEIASAMLQRQQAAAIIDARQKIVEGAVGMVEMALDKLNEHDIVTLDEERKAAMVSNLLVVLCGNKDAQPVVNSGSLY